MDDKLKLVNLSSYNCRGLRNKEKRIYIFKWLEEKYSGVILLQETHSSLSDEQKWINEWGGAMFFSHGEYNARGVAVLISKNLLGNFELLNSSVDKDGR